jgi:hypothetical protein
VVRRLYLERLACADGPKESWQERCLALLVLCAMVFVIYRVLRDFQRAGLRVSQGAPAEVNMSEGLDENDEDDAGTHLD